MDNNVNITPLEMARWEEMKSIRLEALQNDSIAFGSSYQEEIVRPDDFWKGRLQNSIDKDGNRTLYAEINGKVVGMMGAFWNNRPKMKHNVNIYGVYLSPEYRGTGIARRLFSTLLAELEEIGQFERYELTVNTEQIAALKFYQSFGFEVVGTVSKMLKVDGVYYDEHIMERLVE